MGRGTKVFAMAGATVVAVAAPAVGAATIKIESVTQPPRVAESGDQVKMKVRLVNRTPVDRRGRVTMRLAGGPAAYRLERTILSLRPRVRARGFKRFTIRFTVPQAARPGWYRVRTCLKPDGSERRCRVSHAMRVTD